MNTPIAIPTSAFILRMAHARDRLPEGIADRMIVSGWARARGLHKALDWGEFRSIIKAAYHADESGFRRAGAAAGHAWNFVHEMVAGSWVVVPRSGEFYVAQVSGDVSYDESKTSDDSAYRRSVVWLNEGRGIPRRLARAALQSRMKVQGSTAVAADLVRDIAECVELAGVPADQRPSFGSELRAKLVGQTLDELRSGRIDSYGFERVIAALLRATGGQSVRVVPRSVDKGADVLATFTVAGALRLRVAVQAKHFGTRAPVGRDVVQQLLDGMEAEQADLGIVATSGVFSEDAADFVAELIEAGTRVELVDGEQLAAMIVDCGLGTVELNG
jgi:predicted Mrr-cat superfamily restriction endonuclease